MALAFAALAAGSQHASAATRHVNAASGADTGTCEVQASPCRTVTYAMGQAVGGSPGDAIHVAPGIYDTALGEVFPIGVKSGVHLRSTGTAADTFLDATGANKRVMELLNANAVTVVEGFTIMGGRPTAAGLTNVGGGMTIDGGSPTIRKNVFLNNEARGFDPTVYTGGEARGGALHVTAATPAVVNNVFRGNVARGGMGGFGLFVGSGGAGLGGAVYFEGTGGVLNNNTFYGNSALGGLGGSSLSGAGSGGTGNYGAVHANGPSVNNNILVNNAAAGGLSGRAPAVTAPASHGAMSAINPPSPISNNLFHNNTVNGAASTDDTIGTASACYSAPCASGVLFQGEPGNLRLATQSPAAGAGTATGAPGDDFDGVARPNPPAIGAFEPVAYPVRLGNISTRMQVLTGNDVMIGGFVIGGSGNKTVVVRARGPSLIPFGITNALANPQLQLVRSSDQGTIATNDDWQSAGNASAVTASGFAPSDNLEAAILVSLPPGAYTAIVSGVANGTGVAIVEVFEVDGADVPLTNISTRGQVLTGNDVMIGGFVVSGLSPQTVVVRARGPSLIPFGITNALANPHLSLVRSSDQGVIATNDDWQSAANAGNITVSGFAPSNNLESAILISLPPGAYTAIVSGVANGTGVGIVEVFTTP